MAQVIDIPIQDLPYWMRQARRGRDWGFLLALVLGLLAAWPFISRPGLARTNASENYVYLTADYADALREGRLYPRWSPNALHGYGAPVPHYFPPGAPYTAALIKVLFTNDDVRGVRVAFSLGCLLAAGATYAFVRRRATAAAGLFASVLFVFSPAFGSTVPYIRGELAEFLALALLPLLLWMVDRLLSGPRSLDFIAVVLVTAALLLTHPPTAAAGMMLAGLLLVRHVHWKMVLVAMLLGVTLASFYWLPALLEREAVTWISTKAPEQLSLAALITPLQPIDLNELIPRPQFTLGLPLLLVVLMALGSQLIWRQPAVFHNRYLVAGVGLIACGLIFSPNQVWLLGPVTLCLAVAGSGLTDNRHHLPERWRRLYPAGLTTLALMLSLPVLLVPPWPAAFGGSEPIDQIMYEGQWSRVAVLPPDFLLPVAHTQLPPANRLLLSGYESGNINKIAPLQAATRAQINLIAHETHRERFQVQSTISTPVQLFTAYFPGWQASASGRQLVVYPDEQNGLINFELPPTSGELVITLGPTPLRQNAWLVSTAALFIMLLVGRRLRHHHEPPVDVNLLSIGEARLLSIIVAALAVIVIGFAAPSSFITMYGQPGYRLDDATTLRARTNVGLEVLAYQIMPDRITLYWQALRTLPANYRVQMTLSDPDTSTVVYQSELREPGNYPTSRWRTYLYVSDRYELPDTLDSGAYQISIEAFECSPNCDSDNRLTFFAINGINLGRTLTLPEVVPFIR